MTILFRNIKGLAGVRDNSVVLRGQDLALLNVINQAWLLVEDDIIAAYGKESDFENGQKMPPEAEEIIDCSGRYMLPAWCDSHTHLVFATSRENEFIDKINGLGYAEIAARGGGILASANKLNEMDEESLYQLAAVRLKQASLLGTGAMEIKSGYGLTVEGELKMLRVIKRLKQSSPVSVKATFLGAHAFPANFKDDREGYIRQVIEEMLPKIAEEKLADYIDVFCEQGFFSPEETIRICEAGKQYGLLPKIHANQLHVSGGVQAGVAVGAVSVDHLESMDAAAIETLAASKTIGTLLPTAAFFLRMPYQPARQLIHAGAAIAIASDFNPGSSPSYNMQLVVAMSCIQLRMLPEEAINAATINGAFAMGLGTETGSITVGKLANLLLTKAMPSLHYLPYSFGEQLVDRVWLNGYAVY